MGFLSKVKNIFFEEEVIEVEDEPKKAKKEEPVAKKIDLPKVEKVTKEEEYTFEETDQEIDLTDVEEVKEEKETKFPMDFDEYDFEEDVSMEEEYQEPAISRRSERRKTPLYDYEEPKVEEVFEEEQIEEVAPKYDFEMEYGKEKESETHGLYEGKSPKKAFTPTPIISPIYGILDKNYKKDDVVTKKEIRLSSASKKIDLDSVREKAYGDLTSDISQSMEEVHDETKYDEDVVDLTEEEDLLYDLNDESTPTAVKKVTVGDAEEYFNELGLEYNIDYKDTSVENSKTSKEKTRRSTEDEVEPTVIESDDVTEEETDDEGLESNLFDLIESMYDEKE